MFPAANPLVLGPELEGKIGWPNNNLYIEGGSPELRLHVVPVAILQLFVNVKGGYIQVTNPLHALTAEVVRQLLEREM